MSRIHHAGATLSLAALVATGCSIPDVPFDDASTGDTGTTHAGSTDAGSTADSLGGSGPVPTSGGADASDGVDSGPGIESDSGSGVVSSSESGADSDSGFGSDSGTGSASDCGSGSGSPTGSDSGSGPAAGTDTGSGSDSDASGSGSDSGSDSGTDTDTGGEQDPCAFDILVAHDGTPRVGLSVDRVLTWGTEGMAALRDLASLDLVATVEDIESAALTDGLFVTETAGVLELRDPLDAAILATIPSGPAHGIASDGSYVWTADAAGITVFDPLGAEVWFEPGVFDEPSVLALPGSLHVFAESFDTQTVLHVDLDTLDLQIVAFEGDFRVWFSDQPRFVTMQGSAHRVYEADGTEILLDLGLIHYGFGDWLVRGDHLVRIDQPGGQLDLGDWRASGSTIVSISGCTGDIVELGELDFTVTAFALSGCQQAGPEAYFAAYDDQWVVSLSPGIVRDQLDRVVAADGATAIDGAASGRIVVATKLGHTQVWDHTENCEAELVAELDHRWPLMTIAEDGNTMFGVGDIAGPGGGNLPGVDVLSLPDGASLAFSANDGTLTTVLGIAASDDGSTLAHLWDWSSPPFGRVVDVPEMTEWFEHMSCWTVPAIAPDGTHAAWTHSGFEGPVSATSQLYQDAVLVDVFEGAVFGFLADDRMLVGTYSSCGLATCTFAGSHVRALDGTVVQDTLLPETVTFHRITDTELLVEDPPRIYDAYSGQLLWTDELADSARPVGIDHVAVQRGASVSLERWRP